MTLLRGVARAFFLFFLATKFCLGEVDDKNIPILFDTTIDTPSELRSPPEVLEGRFRRTTFHPPSVRADPTHIMIKLLPTFNSSSSDLRGSEGLESVLVDKISSDNISDVFVWTGVLRDQPQTSDVTLILQDSSFYSLVRLKNSTTHKMQVFQARSVNSSYFNLVDIAELRATNKTTKDMPPPIKPASPPCHRNNSECQPANVTAQATVIDLMIAFTEAAEQQMGGTENAKNTILAAVSNANAAFKNGNIPVSYNFNTLIKVRGYNYDGAAFSSQLGNLYRPNDGILDDIPSIRNQVKADLVCLIVADSPNECGLGFVVNPNDDPTGKFGYSIVARDCLPFNAMTHELGHNLGSQHSSGDATSPAPIYPYSYGFKRCLGDQYDFHTIMAYPCNNGANAYPLNYFSSPDFNIAGCDECLLGKAGSADNVQSITRNAPRVAAFRG